MDKNLSINFKKNIIISNIEIINKHINKTLKRTQKLDLPDNLFEIETFLNNRVKISVYRRNVKPCIVSQQMTKHREK